MVMNTNNPSKMTSNILRQKMIRVNQIKAEASEMGSNNIQELLELEDEIKELRKTMMSYIKTGLINKIIRERTQYYNE